MAAATITLVQDKPVIALADIGNAASIRVAEKIGFVKSHQTRYEGVESAVLRLPPPRRRPAP
jgi:RimJ/RimL family protein N-acetyltransferase